MSEALQWLDLESLEFPPLSSALSEPNGLLAIGGDLSAKRLVAAYSQAIFPWFNAGEPPLWWSPTPRAIIPINQLYINRTLKKVIRQKQFSVSINSSFKQVIQYCSDAPFRKEGTWINEEMILAYNKLHELGFAHSIEVWLGQKLVGGLYGVAINGYFSGESMFYTQSNASKIALVALGKLLANQNITFIDCQMINPFLASMGCIEIPRDEFLLLQKKAMDQRIPKQFWQPQQGYTL